MGVTASGFVVDLVKTNTGPNYGQCVQVKNPETIGDVYGRAPYQFFLVTSPTCNCQLCSIGALCTLVDKLKGNSQYVREVLMETFRLTSYSPNLILGDVKTYYCPPVESAFTVVKKTLYTSTNSSEMCLYILRLK